MNDTEKRFLQRMARNRGVNSGNVQLVRNTWYMNGLSLHVPPPIINMPTPAVRTGEIIIIEGQRENK